MLKQAKQETMEQWARQGFETELTNSFALGGVATLNTIMDYIEEYRNA